MKKAVERLMSGTTRLRVTALLAVAFMLCATSAWATLSVGDTVPGLSNTGTEGTVSKYSECCFSFCIPATDDLPEGSVVRIKKIKFAEVATHGTNENTPYFLALNTCQSAAVVQDTVNKIQANSSTSCNTLSYSFESSQCLIVVGTTYTQLGADGGYNAYRFNSGYGLTFLHSNGNRWSSGTTMQCAVTFVNTSDSDSVIATTTSSGAGYYPVYDIEAEVVSIPNALTPDFEYNTSAGSVSVLNRSGNWTDSLSSQTTDQYRVGPNSVGFVHNIGSSNPPYANLSARTSAFSFAIYADVSKMAATAKKRVLVGFGRTGQPKLVLYRDGDYLKLGFFDGSNNGLGSHAEVEYPTSGFHLIVCVCDLSTGTLTLHVDSTSDTQSRSAETTLQNGFQIGAIYNNDTAFEKAGDFGLAKFIGYDRALTGDEVAELMAIYPSTDGTQIEADISPSSGTTTVYTSTAIGNQYLGITGGTLTIPANNTVTVPQMRVMNTEAVTVNIAGTVEVDSTMDSVLLEDEFINSYKGVVLGGAGAIVSGTYNITGILNAPNAYMYSVYKGSSQTINISGSQAKLAVKGIIDKGYYGDVATINLSNGGTLEVGSIVSLNPEIPGVRNFGNGTYRVLSTSTENRQIVFGATGENEYTTIDPYGNTLTFPGAVWKVSGQNLVTARTVYGSGAIKVASSVANGRVKFNNITTDYTGNITVAANSTMELVAGAYAGTITVETGGTLEINPGTDVDYTCYATLAGAGSVVIKSGNVTLANAPTVTSAISVDAGATLKLPTGTISGVSGSGTLEIPNGVEVTVTENTAITVGSLKGPGSLILSGKGPGASNTTLKGLLQNGNWNGTFALVHVDDDDSNGLKGFNFHEWGNSGSKLRLTGVNGYLSRQNTAEQIAAQPELVLENGTGDYPYGFRSDDGFSYTVSGNASENSYTIIRKLSGSGTLKDNCNPSQLYVFNDASGFAGSIIQSGRASPWGKTYVFSPGATPSALPGRASSTTFDGDKATCGTINVLSGASLSIGDGESWQTQNGIRIAGNVELKGTATLSSATMLEGGATLKFKNLGASESPKYLTCSSTLTLPTSGTVTLNLDDVTIPAAGATLISASSLISSDAAKFNPSKGVVRVENGALMVYPVATITKSDDSIVAFDTVQAAVNAAATPAYSGYKYVTIYQSDATPNMASLTLKVKIPSGVTGVVIGNPFEEYANTPSDPDDNGVVTYTLNPTQTTYTWASTLSSGVWNTSSPYPWRYGASVQANRAPTTCDDIQFATDATITVNEDISVYSITNSTNVVFSTTATPTVAANAEGGIVLTAAGASFTVPVGMTLSPTPTTSVANCFVVTTGGGESPTVYTAVLGAATVGGTPYLTLKTAVEAAGENTITLLQNNTENDIVLPAGRVVNILKGGYNCVTPATVDGVDVLPDYDSETGITTYTSPRAKVTPSSGNPQGYETKDEALTEFAKAINADAGVTMTILDGSYITDPTTLSYFITLNIYYDAVNGVLSKAVAKTSTATYGSLASAIADSADGAAITLVQDSNEAITLNKTITLTETATFTGSFTGSGTLIMTSVPKALNAARWATGWEGVLWLKNCTLAVESSYDPIDFGNSTSTLRLTGCTGGFNSDWNSSGSIGACALDLQDDNETVAFTISKGFPASGFTSFAKLTGSGTLASIDTATTRPNASQCYRFRDASEFVGSIAIGASSTLRVVIGGEDSSNTGNSNPAFVSDYRKIVVKSGASATISAGKTWSASGGFTIDGELTVESNNALSSKAVQGSGTIIYEAAPNNGTTKPSFHATLWTGVVEFQEFAAAGIKLAEYGTSNSKIKINGITSGYLMWEDQDVQAEVVLAGAMNITATSTKNYTYAHISGTGSFSVATGTGEVGHPSRLAITRLDVAAGSVGMAVTNNTSTTLNIGTLALPEGASVAAGTKLLKIGGTGTIRVGSVTVGGVTQSELQLAYASDGVYVACASYGGDGYISVSAAIDAAVADGGDVSTITILDGSTTLPAGYEQYYIDNGTICKYQAAVVTVAATTTTNYVATAQAAADAADGVINKYVVLYTTASIDAARDIMIECVGDVSVTLNCTVAGKSYGEPVAVPVISGLYNYRPSAIAATFVWKSAVSSGSWSDVANWECDDGVVMAAPDNALYTEVFESDAEVVLEKDLLTAGIEINADVTFRRANNLYPTINGGIVLKTADATLTVGGGVTVSTPTTSVADSYVKLDGSTYSVDAYNTVSFTVSNATVTRTDDLGANIKDGDTITFTVAADSGYSVTGVSASSGSVTGANPYSYVVNGNATITVTTKQDAEITNVTFDYYVGYTNADVRVTVDQAGTYTLTVSGKEYEQTALEAGTIKFENVDVTGVSTSSGVDYTITASEGASGTTGGTSPAQSPGKVTDSGWMAWSKSGDNVGSWKNGNDAPVTPNYGDNTYVDFSGTNTYTAAWISTGEVVTVTTNVKFGDVADPDMTIDANAQAAIRLSDEGGVTFQVLTGANTWESVCDDALGTPDVEKTYKVDVKLDYSKQTYGVDVTKDETTYTLTNATRGATFPLAKGASAMQQVSYLGVGSFISLSGKYVSAGYTADIGTDVSATNVVVSSDFVSTYMGDVLAKDVKTALAPNAARDCANGLNYFESYALGLVPTEAEEKPVVEVTTDEYGKFKVTLKKANGGAIQSAANVALKVTLKAGSTPGAVTGEGDTDEITADRTDESAIFTIDPTKMSGNVHYYRVLIEIGAQ